MSISDVTPDAGPGAVVAEATAALRTLADMVWAARRDGELVDVVAGLQQLVAAAAAVEAGALVEADARDLAKTTLGYGSTGDWLTHVGGLRRGEGKRRLVRARGLTGALSRVRQGLVDGTVSPDQADVVVAAVDALPPQEWARGRGERLMVRHAASLDATDLARAGRHLVEVVDPDGVDRRLEAQLERDERAAHLDRFLAITEDRAGGVRIKGRGSVEDGALIKAALLPLTAPQPPDPRGKVCGDEGLDRRDYGTRLWDALVATAQHGLDTGRVPESHATPARLLVTLDHHTLKTSLEACGTGVGVGVTADGTELPPGVLRRLACDAEVIPAVLGTPSEVLDVGRHRRLVTAAIWTALVLRDRHCSFPGCTRPPVMCHAHHLVHWADGGPTDLHNLALLCGHHHRVVHHTPWQIRLNPHDRQPEFLPPPIPGSVPDWVRSRPRHDEGDP